MRSIARPSRPSDSEAVANGAIKRCISKDGPWASWFETRFALLTMRDNHYFANSFDLAVAAAIARIIS
jgi:hypothetical protein